MEGKTSVKVIVTTDKGNDALKSEFTLKEVKHLDPKHVRHIADEWLRSLGAEDEFQKIYNQDKESPNRATPEVQLGDLQSCPGNDSEDCLNCPHYQGNLNGIRKVGNIKVMRFDDLMKQLGHSVNYRARRGML